MKKTELEARPMNLSLHPASLKRILDPTSATSWIGLTFDSIYIIIFVIHTYSHHRCMNGAIAIAAIQMLLV